MSGDFQNFQNLICAGGVPELKHDGAHNICQKESSVIAYTMIFPRARSKVFKSFLYVVMN